MSLTNYEKVKCPCGEIFVVELYSSINAQQDPDLKEVLLTGELNLVKCPKCNTIFYAEHFVLYFDPLNELLAFVYPENYRKDKEHWQKKMMDDFDKIQEDIVSKKQLNYSPSIFFGLDDLLELLHYEELQSDEISIFENIKENLKLKSLKLHRTDARKKRLPFILPYIEKEDSVLEEKVITGIKKLLQFMPDLLIYKEALDKIGNDVILEQEKIRFL